MKKMKEKTLVPINLLKQLSKYAGGKQIYIPKFNDRIKWGTYTGAKKFYEDFYLKIYKDFIKLRKEGMLCRDVILNLAIKHKKSRHLIKRVIIGTRKRLKDKR